jgi:hypothetical protein
MEERMEAQDQKNCWNEKEARIGLCSYDEST